jgi:tetratricopeptide (TPR) repeat protein
MQKALDALNQALVLWRAISKPDSEAGTLRNIADIYISMSEPQKALDFYNQALDILRRVNAPTEQARRSPASPQSTVHWGIISSVSIHTTKR